jgi:hypothetical protein
MAEWRVETHLRTGEHIALLPWNNLQFERNLNGARGIRCTVPLHHANVTQSTIVPGLHELWIRRNGTVVACGPLWDVTASSQDKTLSLEAQSLEDYLDVMIIGDTDSATLDQSAWAWKLIDDSQDRTNGNYGIIPGTLQTGITRTFEWKVWEQKYVQEAIQDMSELADGFDWRIKPDRTFNAYFPRPQTDRGLVLKYPETLSGYAMQYFGKMLRNFIYVQGPEPWQATADDPASRAIYGRRDYADALKDVKHVNELTDYASKLRDTRSKPRMYPTFVLRTGLIDVFNPAVLDLGDKFRVIINDGYVVMNQQFRHVGHQVTVSKNGSETVVLYTQDLVELS